VNSSRVKVGKPPAPGSRLPASEYGQQMFVLLELFAQQGKSSAGGLHLGLPGQYIVQRSLTNSALSCPCKLAGNGAESAANSLGISRVNDRSTCHMLVT
jgi:hypothetical protein